MNKKTTFATLLTLLALLFQSFVAPQPAAAAFCDAAQFVADISVQDGKSFNVGETFDKTWRLKNVGTCTWTSSYALSFFSGDPMGASASVAFPNQSVAPGATVDLTVPMKAPNVTGPITGNWKLKNANGAIFGIGAAASLPFWVKIQVNAGTTAGTVYNFAENIASAIWTNGPGARVDNPTLEDGTTFSGAGIQMILPNVNNTFIQAEYPAIHIQSGDRFQSIVNCEYQATSCFVIFRLDYKIGSDPTVRTFWSFREAYERLYFPASVDLSSLAGQDVKFILCVNAAGSGLGDRALWAGPRITRSGGTSATNTPVVTGTPPTPTNTPVPNNGADRVTFIADVNVPDGTVYPPNVAFTKTWKIKNTGTSTWTRDYKLVFVPGVDSNQMGGPDAIPLTSTVGPNTSIELSVNLRSPSTNGRYKGFWMLQNAAGARFGLGSRADQPWWVEIVVAGGSNFTATPTLVVTGTPPTKTATPAGPTQTPTPNRGPDRATFIVDVNVPDGTTFGPNAAFTKTWKIKNTGTSTWTTAYKLVFVPGVGSNQMNGPSEQSLPNVAPNATVDISVNLISPAIGGTYRGYWMLKNTSGQLFGIGATANRPFWVDIFVSGTSITATPIFTATITKTLIPGTPSVTPVPGSCTDRALLLADVTVPDGRVFPPNTAFTKTWRIQNVGTCTWSTSYTLVFAHDSQMGGPATLNLPATVAPNATIELSVNLTAPAANGHYRGYWQFKNASGGLFGIGPSADTPFWVDINVDNTSSGPTATITRTSTAGTPTVTITRTSTPGTPTVTPTGSGSFAVVEIASDDTLTVRSGPGVANPAVSPALPYNAINIARTGSPSATVSTAEWWEIQRPGGGTGWVNSFYLTEYVPPATFCADAKVTALLTSLGNALKSSDGAALAALVSPKHGVDIRLVSNNDPVNYSKAAVASIFTSTTIQNWGPAVASGDIVTGTFKTIMQPKLLDVYNSTFELTCNDTSKVGPIEHPWPSEYATINFKSIYKPATGTALDWRDFLVGIEYLNGQPYLFSLVHFEWAP